MPKFRRKAVILNSSWVDCQAARRASRGCEEVGAVWVGLEEERLERRVSWIPGAEGAPFVVGFDEEDAERLVVEVG